MSFFLEVMMVSPSFLTLVARLCDHARQDGGDAFQNLLADGAINPSANQFEAHQPVFELICEA
jgi:hypothetical protein